MNENQRSEISPAVLKKALYSGINRLEQPTKQLLFDVQEAYRKSPEVSRQLFGELHDLDARSPLRRQGVEVALEVWAHNVKKLQLGYCKYVHGGTGRWRRGMVEMEGTIFGLSQNVRITQQVVSSSGSKLPSTIYADTLAGGWNIPIFDDLPFLTEQERRECIWLAFTHGSGRGAVKKGQLTFVNLAAPNRDLKVVASVNLMRWANGYVGADKNSTGLLATPKFKQPSEKLDLKLKLKEKLKDDEEAN